MTGKLPSLNRLGSGKGIGVYPRGMTLQSPETLLSRTA
jgi:hypothetical protein